MIGSHPGRAQEPIPAGARLVGSLSLPGSGLVYVDSQILIYTVERHPVYEPLLAPLWLLGTSPERAG